MAAHDITPTLLDYFQQQQAPTGWLDLLTIMASGTIDRVGKTESRLFFQQIGDAFAQQFPLPLVATVGELEMQINICLAKFNWGIVMLDVNSRGLVIHHQALPVAQDQMQQGQWCHAFIAIMEGVYSNWLLEQDIGDQSLSLQVESQSLDEVQFCYQGRG